MVNKKTWLGILVMVLIFGMAVVGCDEPTDENGFTGDTAINGTWEQDNGNVVLKFNNGQYENSRKNGNMVDKGTYTTADGKINITITHVHGDGYSGLPESKWYSKQDILALGFTDTSSFRTYTCTYSVNGNTFSMAFGSEASTYTKK
jgi:hypothetical protein